MFCRKSKERSYQNHFWLCKGGKILFLICVTGIILQAHEKMENEIHSSDYETFFPSCLNKKLCDHFYHSYDVIKITQLVSEFHFSLKLQYGTRSNVFCRKSKERSYQNHFWLCKGGKILFLICVTGIILQAHEKMENEIHSSDYETFFPSCLNKKLCDYSRLRLSRLRISRLFG